MDDNQIIALFFARSEQAISELDRKYGAVCHNLSFQILQDRLDAQECVNDAYLGIWNAVPPQRPNPLLTFLCALVRKISITRYHYNTAAKRNSRYTAALEELEGCLAAPDTPEAAAERKELVRLLERFLDSLSRTDRVIFLRRYWFADGYAEIARQVGLSEKNVSVRLSRTRKLLREYLIREDALP